jgi:peroxiredoxin Q/BCP
LILGDVDLKLRRIGLFFATLLFGAATSAAPEVGDLAPDWTLPGSDGNEYRLSDLLGKHVVIAFFPKAYTSG